MQENQNLQKDPWMLFIVLTPSIIALTILNTSDKGSILLSATACGLIAGLGSFILQSTKSKSWLTRLFISFLFISATTITCLWAVQEPNDASLLEQKWLAQQLGETSFKVPYLLKKESVDVPDDLRFFYEELLIFSDQQNKRATLYIQFKLREEIGSLEAFFPNALDGMLQKIGLDPALLKVEKWKETPRLIERKISYEINNKHLSGYAYMHLKGKTIESLWLFPYKKGFSDAYIAHFSDNINALRL